MKTVQLEYGPGYLTAQLPDSADVFVAGETVPDPPFLQDVVTATRESIQNPIGMPPIPRLVGPGRQVTICFPDRVKGGFQENSHRKTAIPLLIEECLKAGVAKEDILLICSTGLHRKNRAEEIRALLGDSVYNAFMPTHQIMNHDSEDRANLVDLGCSELGDPVIMNRQVFESDLAILVGHVLGNPYGGYSGGYKMPATGLTHWRSIAAHHVPSIMHRPDFVPVSPHSVMRQKMNAIGRHMENKMGCKFFMCDAVLDTFARQIAIFSGCGSEIQPLAWSVADRRTYIPWAEEKYDIMVFGMPQAFQYGDGHGTNPILIQQAIAANIIRHQRVLKDNAVVICASICNGYFHDEEFTGYRELYDLFQKDGYNLLVDLDRFGESFCNRTEYICQYREEFGYHPFHGFSMLSCAHLAEMHTSATYIVGAQIPGYARALGMKTRATVEEALRDAERYTGPSPRILALPKAFRQAAVHLMLRNQSVAEI